MILSTMVEALMLKEQELNAGSMAGTEVKHIYKLSKIVVIPALFH